MIDTVPSPAGVNTPKLLTVPADNGLTDQVTAESKFPVPVTLALHVAVSVMTTAVGEHETDTPETLDMVGTVPTETVAAPDLDVSWTEVAVIVAAPAAAGVKMPLAEIVPFVAVHVTALLRFPVPETLAVHAAVWLGRMEAGLHWTATDVIVKGALTATFMLATLLVSCVEVAVMIAVPSPADVNRPEGLMVPFVAVQETDWLKLPVPETAAEH